MAKFANDEAAIAGTACQPGRSRWSAIGYILVPSVVLLLLMFVVMVNLHLVNQLWSVMRFYLCLLVPFTMIFLVNFFQSVPREFIEASVVDGAGPRTLWSVVPPLLRPALATIAVVNAAWACNELLVTSVSLQNESQRTVTAGLTLLQGRYVSKQPLVPAVAVLSILPVALFYLLTQRSFVPGLKAGWEK